MPIFHIILRSQFNKFVITGILNTGITYVLYLLALYFMKYPLAYTFSFLCGIGISYFLNSSFVFASQMSLSKAINFVGGYLLQYLFSLGALYFLVNNLRISPSIAPILILGITVPATFLFNKMILRDKLCN